MGASPMSHLILVLPLAPVSSASEYAFVLSDDGQNATRHGTAIASALPASGRGRQVVAVVPWSKLSWHSASLPPGLATGQRRQQARLRAALDGLLEEQLLDDPGQLHLALAPDAAAGSRCWIAACDKAWLRSHLQALENARLPVDRIAPEISPHSEPTAWTVGDADSPWLLATGLDGIPGIAMLPLRGEGMALGALLQSLPEDTTIQAEPATAPFAEELGRPMALIPAAQRALAASASGWDLAQFELDQGRQSRMRRQALSSWQGFWRAGEWRAARWAALVAIVAQLAGVNAWAWKQNQAIAQKKQLAQKILTDTFPKIPLVVDAPVQMQREVASLRSGSGALSSGDLEPLLAASAHIPGMARAQAIDYQERQLRIKGLALEGEALADTQESLAGLGYALQRDGADLVLAATGGRP